MFMEIAWILLILGLITSMLVVGLRERKARLATAKVAAASTPATDLDGLDTEMPEEFGVEEAENFDFNPEEFK